MNNLKNTINEMAERIDNLLWYKLRAKKIIKKLWKYKKKLKKENKILKLDSECIKNLVKDK